MTPGQETLRDFAAYMPAGVFSRVRIHETGFWGVALFEHATANKLKDIAGGMDNLAAEAFARLLNEARA